MSRVIVGVLQNPWFKPDTAKSVIERYRVDGQFRSRVLGLSHSGRILKKHLGDKLFREIYWTNASPVAGNSSGHKSAPDITHLSAELVGARTVIAFGQIAQRAVEQIEAGEWEYLRCGHPAMRLQNIFADQIGTIMRKLGRDAV